MGSPMRSPARALTVATCLLLGATSASLARAQSDVDRATARTLGQDGEKALAAKDYKTAEDDFRRAESLVNAPTLLLGLARALVGEGKLVEASETYKRIVREGVAPGAPAVFKTALDDAGKEVQDVTPRIGAVTITVKSATGAPVANVQVTMDGAPVNAAALGVRRPADPGAHVVHASADGFKAADVKITVPVGGPVDAPLTLEVDPSAAATPPPPAAGGAGAPPPSMPDQPPQDSTGSKGFGPWPWVVLGVGGAGLVVGGITGGLAIGKHSSLASSCTNGSCGPSQQSDLDSYHTMALVSTIGFIVGGVGVAGGVALLLLQPKSDAAPPATGLHVVPVVGPGSLGAFGTF
jgi:hypothetical protein